MLQAREEFLPAQEARRKESFQNEQRDPRFEVSSLFAFCFLLRFFVAARQKAM